MTEIPENIIQNKKMDKKGSFPPSFSTNTNKVLTLDNSAKASTFSRQDGTSGSQNSKVQFKNPPRSRSTFTGNSSHSRNENSLRNRNNFQRGRGNWEKKGKPRGDETTTQSVVSRKDEPGSLQCPGGKKQNFDDLWGFRFAPRDGQHRDSSFSHGRSHPPNGGQWRYHNMTGPNRSKHGKEYAKHYLLANCQFLVRMGEDYSVYLADPNLLVSWDLIEHVKIRIDGEVPKCPICLDFPVAAKITKCGHIYCWPCFLHYLSLSDNKTRTCPICYESVGKNDLKSVSIMSQEGIQIKSEIEMQLMVRYKETHVAVPFEKFHGWEAMFCKILQVAPTKLIESVINKEREELSFVFRSDPDAPEVCFIQEALEELSVRESSLLTMNDGMEMPTETLGDGLFPVDISSQVQNAPLLSGVENGSRKQRNDSVSSNSSGEDHHQMKKLASGGHEHCYFYQIRSGHNVFLHPMNMAMLWRELGPDPEKWPQVLTFRVIDVESRSASDELKKRMKFVRHLPQNAPFELVEVSMEGWGISPAILADFASQIRQREQRRKNRAKEEKNLERRQREREEMEFNKLQYMPEISSPQEFPAFGFPPADFGLPLTVVEEDIPNIDGASGGVVENQNEELSLAVTSFAKIAGKAPLKRSPTFPIVARNQAGPTLATAPKGRHSDSENDGEDYIPVPNYRASMSDAIEKAMAGLSLKKQGQEKDVDSSSPAAMAANGNKKKKNKKGKVLFATGMGAFN